MMNNTLFLIVAIIAAIGAATGYYVWQAGRGTAEVVTTFEECEAAGYPIMESYPRQCRTSDGMLFIEDISDETANQNQNPPTSADDAPPGSVHNLPVPEGVGAARTAAAKRFNVDESEILILTAFEREWPNACLGLPDDDELCAEAITPGYEVTLQVAGDEYVYRTNVEGTEVRPEF